MRIQITYHTRRPLSLAELIQTLRVRYSALFADTLLADLVVEKEDA